MTLMVSMSSTDRGSTCSKCGEMVISPDRSVFVSEWSVLNFWSCAQCGEQFDTMACRLKGAELETSATKDELLRSLSAASELMVS
jgi:formylmethanofuran dehydrogenase subunit E